MAAKRHDPAGVAEEPGAPAPALTSTAVSARGRQTPLIAAPRRAGRKPRPGSTAGKVGDGTNGDDHCSRRRVRRDPVRSFGAFLLAPGIRTARGGSGGRRGRTGGGGVGHHGGERPLGW